MGREVHLGSLRSNRHFRPLSHYHYQFKVTHQSVLGKAARWKRNGVIWSNYTDAVEEAVKSLPTENNITKRIPGFNKIITDAAMAHVGKTKPKKTSKTYMTPTVRAALKKRNKLRKNVRHQREEWLDACKEAQEEISKARQESWEDLLESTLHENDDQKMGKIINSLKACPETNSPNEALKHKDRTITSNQKKADLFVQHYANVSKHSFTKEERALNGNLRKKIMGATVDKEDCKDFTLG